MERLCCAAAFLCPLATTSALLFLRQLGRCKYACRFGCKKIKQATAPSLWWYDRNKQSLPKIGDLFDVTDWNGTAKAIIELTKLEVVPFNKVSAAFAFAEGEGEGDKSLAYWRRVHKAYYAREMEAVGAAFVENMLISCEYFKTVFSLVMITPQSPTLPSF